MLLGGGSGVSASRCGTVPEWRRNGGTGPATGVPAEVRTPASTEEIVDAVRAAAANGRRLRMAGTGHSFTGVALTDGILLLPGGLTGVRSWHHDRVTVRAGTPLKALNELLDERGLALANMGDITAQTVAGAIQTGTHGTGRDTGGLADQVTELELVLADGSRGARPRRARTCSTPPGWASARSAC